MRIFSEKIPGEGSTSSVAYASGSETPRARTVWRKCQAGNSFLAPAQAASMNSGNLAECMGQIIANSDPLFLKSIADKLEQCLGGWIFGESEVRVDLGVVCLFG